MNEDCTDSPGLLSLHLQLERIAKKIVCGVAILKANTINSIDWLQGQELEMLHQTLRRHMWVLNHETYRQKHHSRYRWLRRW